VSTPGRTSPERLLLLTAVAAVIGLAGGGAAWVLLHLIGGITNLALLHRLSWQLPSLAHLHGGINLVGVAVLGGLVVSVLALWSPEIRGHGIPEAMEAVMTKQSRISPRAAIAKPLSAAIAIGTGGPFGAEGPIIVTGGALGSLVGQLLPVSPSERKILLASGAAAGMAATFGAPLASVVLAIELLLFEFSVRAFVPLVVASTLAGGVHSALFGTGPLFAVPPHHYAGLDKLPAYAVLGLVCGVLAVVITRGLFVVESGYRRLPISLFWHPLLGAVGFAVIGLVIPRVLGVGYDQISAVLTGRLALTTVAILAVAKLAAWWVALASGTSGGTLAPLLLISGCCGTLIGSLANTLFPGAHISPGGFALVAMGATFGASVRATFTGIVFLFELTRDYQIILPLMLATVLAEIVATFGLPDSLMTEKLSRRGLRVQGDYEVDVLSGTLVRDVMSRSVETVTQSATVGEVRALMETGGHGAYPIVDGAGRLVGIVARHDLFQADVADRDRVSKVAKSDVVTAAPSETLFSALKRILEEDIGHLPVVERGELVGMCTRTDILRARRPQMQNELTQPGWVVTSARGRRHWFPLLLRRGGRTR
jgi:CIC family chloride channel protein